MFDDAIVGLIVQNLEKSFHKGDISHFWLGVAKNVTLTLRMIPGQILARFFKGNARSQSICAPLERSSLFKTNFWMKNALFQKRGVAYSVLNQNF